MNDTTFDATLTARELVRGFEKMAPGRYVVTRYGKPWRVIVVEEVGAGSGTAAGPAPVDCVAVQPAPVLVGKVAPLPAESAPALDVAPVVVAGRPLKVNAAMARFLAGKPAAADSVPADDLPAEAESMTRAKWRRMSPEARTYYIKHSTALDSDEAVAEWLEGLPA